MVKVSSGFSLARQWEMLKLIPSRGEGITAAKLTKRLRSIGYQVSKRTVERDLIELSRLFGIDCNDKSKPFGWRWMVGAGVNLPSLTLSDAVSLYIVESHLRLLVPAGVLRSLEQRFEEAKQKLSQIKGQNSLYGWEKKIRLHHPTMPLLAPKIDDEVLDVVHMALMGESKLSVTYKSHGAVETKVVLLNPLGLVQRGSVAYLVATAFEYSDVRLYALHRIFKAEVTNVPVEYPDGFNLDDYAKQGAIEFGGGGEIKFRAKVNQALAEILEETPLSTDMKISRGPEWVSISATVVDSWQLRWWILSQGASIEVVAPKILRNEITKELKDSLSRYQKS